MWKRISLCLLGDRPGLPNLRKLVHWSCFKSQPLEAFIMLSGHTYQHSVQFVIIIILSHFTFFTFTALSQILNKVWKCHSCIWLLQTYMVCSPSPLSKELSSRTPDGVFILLPLLQGPFRESRDQLWAPACSGGFSYHLSHDIALTTYKGNQWLFRCYVLDSGGCGWVRCCLSDLKVISLKIIVEIWGA